ncbi:MAG: hypothetical protein ACK4SM_05850 [Aquificaceae bacterium]
MYMICDDKRVYVSENYRVSAYDKEDLVNAEKKSLVWKTFKLYVNLKKLINTKDYLYGIGEDRMVRIDKTDGHAEDLSLEDHLIDVAGGHRDLYLLTKTALYRMSIERFSLPEIKRLAVSDTMDKPLRALCLSDENIYVASRSYVYKLDRDGKKLLEKALTDIHTLLISEDGPVGIREDGKVLNLDESLEVSSTGEFDGRPIKAEYSIYQTYLLTEEGLHIFGKTGKRIAHVENGYLSFSEGLNHVYLYKEDGLEAASKADILGDTYQKVDLTTVCAVVFASMMAFEREKGKKVSMKKRKGYMDVRVDDLSLDLERLTYRLSRYFPEVFILFSNPGYYESMIEFGEKFELVKGEDEHLHLNYHMLNHLVEKHSAFKTFKEGIISTLETCLK